MGCSNNKQKVIESNTRQETQEKENEAKRTQIIYARSLTKKHSLIAKKGKNFSTDYQIIEKLYEKPFEKIYKVLHLLTNQTRLMRDIKTHEPEKFLKEIQFLSELDHPNIIKVYEYFTDKTSFQIITELVTGDQLVEKITKVQVFNEINAAKIMKQLFSCVAYLHDKNIIHRDINIGNIYFENDNLGDYSIKIMYFGNARVVSKDEQLNDRTTDAYFMAPEVIRKTYDKKCDIWSLGVILYVLLSGFYPFDGQDKTDIMEKIVIGKYSLDSHEWEHISKEGKELVKALLNFHPKERPEAKELINHPWIVKYVKEDDIVLPVINQVNLHYLSSKRKLEKATINYLIHNFSTNSAFNELKKIFQSIDKSGKGALNYSEMKTAWKEYFKSNYSELEFDKLFNMLDENGSKRIEYEDFLKLTIDFENILSEKNLKAAFDFFDKNHTGFIGVNEIKHFLGVYPDDAEGHKLAQGMLEEFVESGQENVSFEQFKSILRRYIDK
jgi:calcium-dependent protein kinase